MWISRRLHRSAEQPVAESGTVLRSSQNGIGAGATLETRDIVSCQPYGYTGVPPVEEEVVLLPSADGQVVIGTRSHNSADVGEVVISSLGGARIELRNDGTIRLNSLVIDKNGEIRQ